MDQKQNKSLLNKEWRNAPWLLSIDQISSASNESLVRSLCTSDGKGSVFKEKVLREVILRTIEDQLRIRNELPEISVTD